MFPHVEHAAQHIEGRRRDHHRLRGDRAGPGIPGRAAQGSPAGESAKGESAEALTATDVQPLIEDIAPPPPLPEEKAPEEDEPEAVDPAQAQTPVAPPSTAPAPAKPPGPEDRVGDLLDGVTPPPQDEPPH